MASTENLAVSGSSRSRPPSAVLVRPLSGSEISLRKQRPIQRLWVLVPEGSQQEGLVRLERSLQERLLDRVSIMRYRSPQDLEQVVNSSSELKFVVLGDAQLQWLCNWSAEHRSTPCELLYCTNSNTVVRYEQLVTSEQLQQFKLVTNSYGEVEKYLLSAMGEGQLRVPQQAKVIILFDPALSSQLHQQLEQSIAANPHLQRRLVFLTYNQENHGSLVQALKGLAVQPIDHIFVVVNESTSQQIQVTERTAAETMRKDNPNISVLLISPQKHQRGTKEQEKTAVVLPTSLGAAIWLRGVLEGGVSPMHSRDVEAPEGYHPQTPEVNRSDRSLPPASDIASGYIPPESQLGRSGQPYYLPQPIMGEPGIYSSNNFRPQSPVLRRASSPAPPPRPIQKTEVFTVPRIFVQQSASRWRHFLKKSQVTKRFTSQQYESLDDLSARVNKFLSQNHNDKAWVLLEDNNELQRHRQRLNNANVKYVVYDPSYLRPAQQNDIVLGSDMREEIESYLLNYQKQSKNIISPSHLDYSKNILLLFHKNIQLDKEQLGLWKQRLYSSNVEVGSFGEGPRMMKAIATYPKYSVVVILPQSLDNEFAPALATYSHVRKIILLEPPFLRPSYFEHPSVMFVTENPADINGFLKTLRYSLRHPPKNIAQIFLRPLVNVFVPEGRYNMQYLQFIALLNPSVRLYEYSSLQELYASLKADQNNDALVVGDASLKPKSLKSHHPHVHLMIDNEFNHGGSNYIVMSTDDEREVLLYIKNLPNNRFNRARIMSTPVDVYLDLTAQSTEELKNRVQDIMQVNSSLAVYTYQKLSQLEESLQSSKTSGSTTLIVTEQMEPNRSALETLIAEKRKEKRDISGVLLENGNTPLADWHLYIFSDSQLSSLVDFFDNIPDVLANKVNSIHPSKSPSKAENPKVPSKIDNKQQSIAKITKVRDSELITPIIPVQGMPDQPQRSIEPVPQPVMAATEGKLSLPLPPAPNTQVIYAPIVVPIKAGSTQMIPINIQIVPQVQQSSRLSKKEGQLAEPPAQAKSVKIQQPPKVNSTLSANRQSVNEKLTSQLKPGTPSEVNRSMDRQSSEENARMAASGSKVLPAEIPSQLPVELPVAEPLRSPQSSRESNSQLMRNPEIPLKAPPRPSSQILPDPAMEIVPIQLPFIAPPQEQIQEQLQQRAMLPAQNGPYPQSPSQIPQKQYPNQPYPNQSYPNQPYPPNLQQSQLQQPMIPLQNPPFQRPPSQHQYGPPPQYNMSMEQSQANGPQMLPIRTFSYPPPFMDIQQSQVYPYQQQVQSFVLPPEQANVHQQSSYFDLPISSPPQPRISQSYPEESGRQFGWGAQSLPGTAPGQLGDSRRTATFNNSEMQSDVSAGAQQASSPKRVGSPQSEYSSSNEPRGYRGLRSSLNVELKPNSLVEFKSRPQINYTEIAQPLAKPFINPGKNIAIGQQLPNYVTAGASSRPSMVSTATITNFVAAPAPIAMATPTITPTKAQSVREQYTPYQDIAHMAPASIESDLYRYGGIRSPSRQYSPRSPGIISNPLNSSTDNSQLVADNPMDGTVSSIALTTICLLYSNNFEATRYKDYIERVADPSVTVQSFPFRTMHELESLISNTHDSFNKSLIVLSHEFRGLADKCESLERTKGKLRTYLLTQSADLVELMNVVNVGSEWTLMGLPYRTETLPIELQLARRIKVLLPSDYFRDMYRKVALTDFIRYDSPGDIDSILSKDCDPTVYNIVVAAENRLPTTFQFPLQYDNTRMVVLVSNEGLSEGKMFNHYGDLFWLYADSNPQGIQGFLMNLTNMKKNDVPLSVYTGKPLLFYQRSQLDRLYHFEYLGYFKVQYSDHLDLQRKIGALLSYSAPSVKMFMLNEQNGLLRIEQLSKAELEYIGSNNSPKTQQGGPFGIPSPPKHSVYVMQEVTPMPPRLEVPLTAAPPLFPLSSPPQSMPVQQQPVLQFPIQSVHVQPPVQQSILPTEAPVSAALPVDQPPFFPWITGTGEFILDPVEPAPSKQRMLIRMFDHQVFRRYGKFGYYYLSNSQQESPVNDLQYRTTEQMQEIFKTDPERLMVVFCDRGDERYLPVEMLNSDRVRIIKIFQQGEFLDSLHLKCEQIEGVINRIKTIQKNCRSKYVVFKQRSAQCEVLLQEFLLHSRDFISMSYKDPEEFDQVMAKIKNKYNKLQVICPESEQPTLRRILDIHKVESVAFLTARSQTDLDELPSDSTLKKEIENLKIEQSPTIRKVQPIQAEVAIASTEDIKPSNVVRHEARVVVSPMTSSRQRPSPRPHDPSPTIAITKNANLPPHPAKPLEQEKRNSELKIRAEPRNQTWLNGLFERINKSSRVMVLHDNLPEKDRSTVNKLAQLTGKVSYIRPKSTAEYQYFLKSTPQGVFLLVGTNPHVSLTHKQTVQIDSEDLDKLLKMLQRRNKHQQNRSSRSLNKDGQAIGSDSNLVGDSREDSDFGDPYYKRRSRLKMVEKKPSGPEEKTEQIDEYEIIKSRINSRQNRFINILNGEELTIFVPAGRQNLEKFLQEETPEVTVIPYENIQQVESQLPKCSKRPTLILVSDDKILAMEKLSDKFPQVRIIASSNVEINHPSVCISLATDGEVLELVRRLRDRNNEVDHRRMEQEMRRISRQEEEIFGYSMTLTLRSLSQKVAIFSAVGKNINIRNMVEKYNSTRVAFTEYLDVNDLKEKLNQLALTDSDALSIVIENDEQIEQIEALNTQHMRVYFVRCFNNHMRYSRELLVYNDRHIFTGHSSKEIANFINSLVYRSFKKLSKALESKRKSKKVEGARISEVGRPEYFATNSANSRTSGHGHLPHEQSNSANSKAKILRHASSSSGMRKSGYDTKHRQSQPL